MIGAKLATCSKVHSEDKGTRRHLKNLVARATATWRSGSCTPAVRSSDTLVHFKRSIRRHTQ